MYEDGFEATTTTAFPIPADVIAYDVVTPELALARSIDSDPNGNPGNGTIGLEDYVKMTNQWLMTQADLQAGETLSGDFNGDGVVNLGDHATYSQFHGADVADPQNFYQSN